MTFLPIFYLKTKFWLFFKAKNWKLSIWTKQKIEILTKFDMKKRLNRKIWPWKPQNCDLETKILTMKKQSLDKFGIKTQILTNFDLLTNSFYLQTEKFWPKNQKIKILTNLTLKNQKIDLIKQNFDLKIQNVDLSNQILTFQIKTWTNFDISNQNLDKFWHFKSKLGQNLTFLNQNLDKFDL